MTEPGKTSSRSLPARDLDAHDDVARGGIHPQAKKAASRLALHGICKSYGSTHANTDVGIDVEGGEIVGLIGANGAGKSTLMRIICGVTEPDAGQIEFDEALLDRKLFSVRAAQDLGIRIVWQELSLCPNLTVAENFYIEQPQHAGLSPWWRTRYRRLAKSSIEDVFPDADIDTDALVGDLPIAKRQMIEIARVVADPALRLLILDEPTSSLDGGRAAQLRSYIRRRAAQGVSAIFISHKLAEVLDACDRVITMRNGRVVWQRPSAAVTIGDMIEAMGGAGTALHQIAEQRSFSPPEKQMQNVVLSLEPALFRSAGGKANLRRGEIVGLAGLEGSGQRRLLQQIFKQSGSASGAARPRIRYVSGDRQKEGVLPLWSVLRNIAIGRTARQALLSFATDERNRPELAALAQKLQLDDMRLESNILQLSGGNQQKALVARALIDDFDILLLDDPTRGVDISAKRDFYRLLRDLAENGKLVIWYSTEDLEFLQCDRVLVFSKGAVVHELEGKDIAEDTLVAAAFDGPLLLHDAVPAAQNKAYLPRQLMRMIPFASLVLVFAAMAWQNPLVASSFGVELLLTPAVPLVLIALAQMFVVGGSEIDLGAGAFTGLVNVISATLLVASPALGVAALLASLVVYALIGVIIHARSVPAIVVTLGASFVWIGIGQTLQPSPGGASPDWLQFLFSMAVPGIPTPLVLIAIAAMLAVLLNNSTTGTVLRGFGANPHALARTGWSPIRYAACRYAIACLFATVAGLFVTASNHASDINASSSFTLLSIAAVVVGGCQLLGGMISPLGVVAGAVTLSLIGALLASLGISTDYNAAVQGALLIGILALKSAFVWRKKDA